MMDDRTEIATRLYCAALQTDVAVIAALSRLDANAFNAFQPPTPEVRIAAVVKQADQLLAELERTQLNPIPNKAPDDQPAAVAIEPETAVDPAWPYAIGQRLQVADSFVRYLDADAGAEFVLDLYEQDGDTLWLICRRVSDGNRKYFYPEMVEKFDGSRVPPPSSTAVDQLGASVMGDLGPALEDEEGQALCDVCTTERSTILTKDGRMLCQPCFTKQVGASL
jgi:hypothetical protein